MSSSQQFFALVFVVFVGQIIAGVWLVTNEDQFKGAFELSLTKSIQNDYGRIDLKTNAFDVIQKRVGLLSDPLLIMLT